MNAGQIAEALYEAECRKPGLGESPSYYAGYLCGAQDVVAALREAGIDLDHTYEEAPVSGFLPFFEGGEVAGIKATIRLIPDDRNIAPLVAYVRRPLDGVA